MENYQDSFILQPLDSGPQVRELTPVFTGSGSEYFRIWIVNVALTVLTFGIYGAWAKVRTRRYFYANTVLDGQPFDYLAKPGAILRGYLIVGGGLLLMNVLNSFLPLFGAVFTAVALGCVPFLIYKAHRFKARYSAWRNVRFNFLGKASDAYKAYIFFPLAGLFSVLFMFGLSVDRSSEALAIDSTGWIAIGIIMTSSLALSIGFPYLVFLQRRYFHDNMAFGGTRSSFSGGSGAFYLIYIRAFAMSLSIPFVLGTLTMFFSGLFMTLGPGVEGRDLLGIIAVMVFIYTAMALIFVLLQQYIFARTFDYSWEHTRLGDVTFQPDLGARALAWIRFSNLIAIFLSLGFFIPWAKVRRTRYILSKTRVFLRGDMDAFEAADISDEGAVGDTAADFFDWDIGW